MGTGTFTNGEPRVRQIFPPEGVDLECLINGIERDLLVRALERSGGVKKEAARLLKLNARSLAIAWISTISSLRTGRAPIGGG